MKQREPLLREIADRIHAHLKRLEADSEFNQIMGDGLPQLDRSQAYASGNRIFCTYVAFQGESSLTRDEATRYLAKLDAGFKGRHFEALRETDGAR